MSRLERLIGLERLVQIAGQSIMGLAQGLDLGNRRGKKVFDLPPFCFLVRQCRVQHLNFCVAFFKHNLEGFQFFQRFHVAHLRGKKAQQNYHNHQDRDRQIGHRDENAFALFFFLMTLATEHYFLKNSAGAPSDPRIAARILARVRSGDARLTLPSTMLVNREMLALDLASRMCI